VKKLSIKHKMGELFSYKTLVHACAGCVGSCAAACISMPLTTASTRIQLEDSRKNEGPLQVMLKLVRDEGFLTLFRGGKSTLISVAVSNFIYFYSFHGLKTLSGSNKQNAIQDLLYACSAGVINVLLTNPLWVVNTRLKMTGTRTNDGEDKLKGTLDGLLKIAINEGVGSLWNGTKASLILVSNPAIKFTVYEVLKRRLTGGKQVSGLLAFVLGCMATAVATAFTYPIQLIQVKSRHGSDKDLGMLKSARKIFKQHGVSGLYRGLDTKLAQSMLAAGFMFMSYETIQKFVNVVMASRTIKNRI